MGDLSPSLCRGPHRGIKAPAGSAPTSWGSPKLFPAAPRRFQADGESMSWPARGRNRKERSILRRKCACSKVEVAFAVDGVVFQILDHTSRGPNSVPVDSRLVRYHHKAVDVLRGGNNLRQQIGLAGIVSILAHGRTNVRREP